MSKCDLIGRDSSLRVGFEVSKVHVIPSQLVLCMYLVFVDQILALSYYFSSMLACCHVPHHDDHGL